MCFILLKNQFTWAHVEREVKSFAGEEQWGENGSRGMWEMSKGHYIYTASAPLSICNGCPILSMLFGEGGL